jgi:CCR4-NOT transcriptional regulation complex NOT5 subunit
MYYFLQSELLSRRLAFYCCKRLSVIFNEFSNCYFEKTLKKLQTKSSDANSKSLLKSNSATNLLSPLSQQQQQKSPDLNATKLKPFVTNLAAATSSSTNNSSASTLSSQTKNLNQTTPTLGPTEATNYILQRDVPIKSVCFLFTIFIHFLSLKTLPRVSP